MPPGIAAATGPAAAHGSFAGGGGFYAGAAHPFQAFEHLLLLLGFGLLLGIGNGLPRAAVGALAAALAGGLALAATGIAWPPAVLAILGLGLALGLLLALGRPLPVAVLVLLGLVSGLLVGLDTGAPVAEAPGLAAALAPYAGVLAAVLLIALDAAALSLSLHRPALLIGRRIFGSWLAAIAVMILAFLLKSGVWAR